MTVTHFFIALAMLGVLIWRYRQDKLATIRSRWLLAKEYKDLVSGGHLIQNGSDFPLLQGSYADYRVELRLIDDSASFRKLPVLWMLVTVHARKRSPGSIDILVRPRGSEFYSSSIHWEKDVDPLPHWPVDALYRTAENAVSLSLIDPHVRGYFSNKKAKELLVMPDRVRLTCMVGQAMYGEYLVLRSTVFPDKPIPRNTVKTFLDQAVALRTALEQEA